MHEVDRDNTCPICGEELKGDDYYWLEPEWYYEVGRCRKCKFWRTYKYCLVAVDDEVEE